MAEMSFRSRVESSSIDGGERRRVASSLLSCKKGLKKKGRRNEGMNYMNVLYRFFFFLPCVA
jgi:hypothetical protein